MMMITVVLPSNLKYKSLLNGDWVAVMVLDMCVLMFQWDLFSSAKTSTTGCEDIS